MTVGLALGITLSLGFVVLSFLMMQMRQELRTTQSLLRQVVEKIPTQAAAAPGEEPKPAPTEWPVNASLHPGELVPSPINKKTRVNWSVLVFAPKTSEAHRLMDKKPQREKLASRYQVIAVAANDDAEALSSTITVKVSPEAINSLPTPAIAMVDPEGTIQGIAMASTMEELLAFVHEGEHHGFGPLKSPEDYNDVEEPGSAEEDAEQDKSAEGSGESETKELVKLRRRIQNRDSRSRWDRNGQPGTLLKCLVALALFSVECWVTLYRASPVRSRVVL